MTANDLQHFTSPDVKSIAADETSLTSAPTDLRNDQSSEEQKLSSSTSKCKDIVVANREWSCWSYPPYCELCSVHFNSEQNAKIHFDSPKNHRNRLHLWKRYMQSEKEKRNVKDELSFASIKE
ncbi:unnamed protein product [Didymodactylos carnosus]|nr:unnamed protein product [Didymodactylos carnosus]CAF3590524.1 unnamed protein product [Didymodactylos carnosus]